MWWQCWTVRDFLKPNSLHRYRDACSNPRTVIQCCPQASGAGDTIDYCHVTAAYFPNDSYKLNMIILECKSPQQIWTQLQHKLFPLLLSKKLHLELQRLLPQNLAWMKFHAMKTTAWKRPYTISWCLIAWNQIQKEIQIISWTGEVKTNKRICYRLALLNDVKVNWTLCFE